MMKSLASLALCRALSWQRLGPAISGAPLARAVSSASFPPPMEISEEVRQALSDGNPVVSLESTIISHGMPYPQNIETAASIERTVREEGCVPATIGIVHGCLKIGLSPSEIELLGDPSTKVAKCSRRDLAVAIAQRQCGATTVSGTMIASHAAGIRVFVTGGLGGVHREGHTTMDVSADLTELGRTPVAVVSAGAKSVLDITRTLEVLETQGVTVATIVTEAEKAALDLDELLPPPFPEFFSRGGSVPSPSVLSVSEAADAILANQQLGLTSGMLFAVPIPKENDLGACIEEAIEDGIIAVKEYNITGKDVTPYLLSFVNKATEGKSLAANIALVHNNARVGSQIAREHALLQQGQRRGMATIAQDLSLSSERNLLAFGGTVCDITMKMTSKTFTPSSTNYGRMSVAIGGVGRNVACAAAEHGCNTHFFTAYGSSEHLAKLIEADLNTHNVAWSNVAPPSSATAVYNAWLDSEGALFGAVADMEVFETLEKSVLSLVKAEHTQPRTIAFADCNCSQDLLEELVTTENPLFSAIDLVWIDPTSVAKTERASGLLLSVTAERRAHSARRVVLSPSEEEFPVLYAQVMGGKTVDMGDVHAVGAAATELSRAYPFVSLVVTLGARGVVAHADNMRLYDLYTTTPLEHVQSVTGAGDNLNGAMMASLLRGESYSTAVRAGMRAAESVLIRGTP